MKPIILYSLPRSRSKLILKYAKRSVLLDESLSTRDVAEHLYNISKSIQNFNNIEYFSKIKKEDWTNLIEKANHPDSCTKIFGNQIYLNKIIQNWFEKSQKEKSHDIFIIERDLVEIGLSYILAKRFGFNDEERSLSNIVGDSFDIEEITHMVDCYIRYFPTNGTLINIENLPESHFERKEVSSPKNQDSKEKYNFISNLDWCIDQIKLIEEYFNEQLEEKKLNLNKS